MDSNFVTLNILVVCQGIQLSSSVIVAQTKIGAQPNLIRTNQHSKFTCGMQSLDPLSWFGRVFLVSLVAGLAERRVPSLTDREQVALGKIEKK